MRRFPHANDEKTKERDKVSNAPNEMNMTFAPDPRSLVRRLSDKGEMDQRMIGAKSNRTTKMSTSILNKFHDAYQQEFSRVNLEPPVHVEMREKHKESKTNDVDIIKAELKETKSNLEWTKAEVRVLETNLERQAKEKVRDTNNFNAAKNIIAELHRRNTIVEEHYQHEISSLKNELDLKIIEHNMEVVGHEMKLEEMKASLSEREDSQMNYRQRSDSLKQTHHDEIASLKKEFALLKHKYKIKLAELESMKDQESSTLEIYEHKISSLESEYKLNVDKIKFLERDNSKKKLEELRRRSATMEGVHRGEISSLKHQHKVELQRMKNLGTDTSVKELGKKKGTKSVKKRWCCL